MPSGTFGSNAAAGLAPNFITFTGASSYTVVSTPATTTALSAPPGVATNVLVLASLLWGGAATLTLPDGTWHPAIAQQTLVGGSTIQWGVWYRVATGVDTTYTFTFSGASSSAGFTCGFSGENTSTPIDANTGVLSVVNTLLPVTSSMIPGPSVVPATANATPVCFWMAQAAAIAAAMVVNGALFSQFSAGVSATQGAAMLAPVTLNQACASLAIGVPTGSGIRSGNPVWAAGVCFIEHP